MRTPLRMLLISLVLTAYANGLPYSHTPNYYTSQQSVQWSEDHKQEYQQQQEHNRFLNVLPEQQVAQIEVGWDQSNPQQSVQWSKDNQEYQQQQANSFINALPEQQVSQTGTNWDQSNPPLYISPPDVYPSLIPQNTDVSGFISPPRYEKEPINKDGLTISCNGKNSICVNRDHCINGYAHSLPEELIQSKNQIEHCNLRYEVCCIVNNYQEQSPSVIDATHVTLPESKLHHTVHATDDPKYIDPAQSDQHNIFADFNPSQKTESSVENDVEQSVVSPSTNFVPDTDINSGVAISSPVTESSGTSFEEVSKEGSDVGSTKIRPPPRIPSSESTTFKAPLQLGCAAALLCVEEQYCTKEGVISTQPVVFTQKDILRRVPLSSCKDPESGLIGKCCRDPNYVDPWPTGNLPANYSGGFDEQGFPTFLNIAKVRPPKKQISATKTRPTVKLPVRPPIFNHEFSTIKTTTIGEPVEENNNNYETPQFSINIPQLVTVPPSPPQNPSIPIIGPSLVPRPFSKNGYESHVKDSLPIIPQYKQNTCGVRNNVPHTYDSDKPVTSFGEIPWQAMILSNQYRTILCSGVIIAPNIVLTTAHCINGIPTEELSVKSGEWKLGYELKHEEPLPFEITNVSSVVVHPHYAYGSSANDIAALFLEHTVAYNAHVNPLCLPDLTQTQTLNRCIVTGWGQAIIKVHALGAVMNSLDVNILSHDVCTQYASNQKYNIDIEHGTVCVRPQNINYNMCQTEVGSPLACEKETGVYELVGLYSQDNGCSSTHQVAVFTPIDNDWLNKIMHMTLNTDNDSYDYRKSNLSSAQNQYLPPV